MICAQMVAGETVNHNGGLLKQFLISELHNNHAELVAGSKATTVTCLAIPKAAG